MSAARFPRILVVDDHEDLQVLAGWIFRDLGYEVGLAGDGWAAIEAIETNRPDLVVLDLVMPIVDGWAVLDHLRAIPSPPPAVVLTARGDVHNFTRAVREGAAAYLFKPFKVRDLVSTCERILGLKRTTDVAAERRQQPRRILALDLAALASEKPPIAWAMLVDLSAGGAQLDLDAPLDPGDRVRFAPRIPDGHVPFSAEGRVQWRDTTPQGFAHGVVFENLAAEQARQLRDLLGPSV